MNGRRLAWYRLASYLRLPLQRVQDETTAVEFLEWNEFLRREREEDFQKQDKLDWYLAQIACEVRRSQAKGPTKIKTDHFLLQFKPSGKKTTSDDKDQAMYQKRLWLGMFGLKG